MPGCFPSPHTCMNCLNKEHSLINDLDYQELALLNQGRSVVNFKKGELIYKEGAKPMGLLCLNSGKVKIVQQGPNGTEQITGLKKPVDFIDVRALVTNSDYRNSAIALEDSSVCMIEKKDFLQVVKANPELSMKIIRMFAKELDESDNRFLNMTQKNLRARLADAILLLNDVYGTLADGETINCQVKRSDLAGLSNMTTANVIRTLSAFSKEGILESVKKRLRIKDYDQIKTISLLN